MNQTPTAAPPDALLLILRDYALRSDVGSDDAYHTAAYCLLDSLGCAIASLQSPACRRVLGPLAHGMSPSQGLRLPGIDDTLDPVTAAFNLGSMIRWLDYNDTWLAAEWGHPSDNLGGLIASALYRQQQGETITLRQLLGAMIKAYEIQGVLALENSFNRVAIDHVILVRIASAAVCSVLLGNDPNQIFNAISNAWVDGGSLRNYRHAPDAGSRKSWAAGDATARGLWLALLAARDEMGYPHVLSTEQWGFEDSLLQHTRLTLPQALDSYVMENILFKVAYAAEFHAQTAIEAAIELHRQHATRLEQVERIEVETQQAAVRIIDKRGALTNPAARDHCLQYMIAVALLKGNIEAADYHDENANDPRIDALRDKMHVTENPKFTLAYHDASKRAIPNALQLFFRDGSHSARIQIDYPLGHRKRRQEAWPLLIEKFYRNTAAHLSAQRAETIINIICEGKEADTMSVAALMALLDERGP